MSGGNIIRQLLVAEPAVTDLVSPEDVPSRIVVGLLGKEVELPALSIRITSSNERKTLTPGTSRQLTDRVQVIAVADDPDVLPALIKAVGGACGHKFPEFPGLSRVVVMPAGAGETFVDEESTLHMRPHDFTVTYSEPR